MNKATAALWFIEALCAGTESESEQDMIPSKAKVPGHCVESLLWNWF